MLLAYVISHSNETLVAKNSKNFSGEKESTTMLANTTSAC